MRICITGASRGLGAALCLELLERGHDVWGIARDSTALAKLQSKASKGTMRTSMSDVSSIEDVHRWNTEMEKAGFIPDIVILNAALRTEDLTQNFEKAKTNAMMKVNVDGALTCIDLLLPNMRKRKSGGFILISSTSSIRPSTQSVGYCMSKAGMAMAFRCFRLRFACENVRFSTVTLGPIATEMWEGKGSLLIGSAKGAARRICTFVENGGSAMRYPLLSTFLLHITRWLPDGIFTSLSRRLLK